MNFLEEKLEAYIEAHTTPESELLNKITRETNLKVLMPRMLSGHIQGQLLKMLSCMIKPSKVLEIGTFTGYSAICLCEGLQTDGTLYTIDINEELETMVRGFFDESKHAHKIKYLLGNAMEIIPTLDEKFDLVFIDADKLNYSAYYDLVFDKVKPGGFIIADNVLWSGKVVQDKNDKNTLAIDSFNKKIHNDPRVENLLLCVRDGLMVVRKF